MRPFVPLPTGGRSWLRSVALRLAAVACLVLTCLQPALAAEPVRGRDCARLQLDARHLEVMHDPSGRMGVLEAQASRFEPAAGPRLNFGILPGALWLRFTLAPGAGCEEPLFLKLGNPFANRVLVHRRTAGADWRLDWSSLSPGGDPGSRRLRQAMFPLKSSPGAPAEYLIEIRGPGAVLAAPAIVPGSQLAAWIGDRILLGGLLAGGIVSLAIYCAVLAALTRLRGLLAYSASALALAVFYGITSGLFDRAVLWLLPPVDDPYDAVLRASAVAVSAAGLFHWFFVRGLLAAEAVGWRSPRQTVPLIAWLVLVAMLPITGARQVSLLSMAVAAVAMIAVGIETAAAIRRRHPLARMTAAAFGVLAVSASGYIAMYLGLLPWRPEFIHATALGVWAEAILLSVAVGVHVKDLRGERQRLAARTQELSQLSQRDPLSGLGNRRAYDALVPATLARCELHGAAASLLVVDIDHFKQVNDRHGHGFGDSVIRALSDAILASVRASDFAFRYGGEEFVVLLPGMAAPQALEVAERIMGALRIARPAAPDGTRPSVSVSVGVSTIQPGDTADSLFARADAAMYRAKHNGRNRAEFGDAQAGAGAQPA
ncbi:MAG TPA: diguanylate cyclase [Quisquiliibacterium sp.]|nr:diguanylate cyclase [Quisquiliibacterium sp.]